MIPAYHAVWPRSAAEAILERGEILPAASRIDFRDLMTRCHEFGEELRERYGITPGWMAVAHRIEKAVMAVMKRAGSETALRSSIPCASILAGDGETVFLSPWDWHAVIDWDLEEAVAGKAAGFVFDAEELVEQGARVRPIDFTEFFKRVVRVVVSGEEIPAWMPIRKWKTMEEADKALMAGFDAVLRKELTGAKALRFLEEDPSGSAFPEIVWRGPLPASWAVEFVPEVEG